MSSSIYYIMLMIYIKWLNYKERDNGLNKMMKVWIG